MSDEEISQLAYEGRYEIFKRKLAENKDLATKTDRGGRVPLHWAASGGHSEEVEYLLRMGVPVDPRDDVKYTQSLLDT
ncbi:26S proteasome non-ATPase regulatory subunit 10-like [Lingula anatina]|uniref:26S proteasome non-ATPase regulatory subunit 10-like n=1 Tax=Lingula anatina TaxID=7574 RepID=A0A1S3KCM5_LINAN|nr:26S proteasome non-ATPase regulatory subunit 10-like [Lingula anatina]|eukprot:XP_013420006.1 26S proteasome non-ATPase regulatory subunit 10-like [Lingula anatina]